MILHDKLERIAKAEIVDVMGLPASWRLPEVIGTTTICRQIHAESRLLLFAISVFELSTIYIAGTFLSRLLLLQRDVITQLRLHIFLSACHLVHTWAQKLCDAGIVGLKGLRHVVIWLSVLAYCPMLKVEALQREIRSSFEDANGGKTEVLFDISNC